MMAKGAPHFGWNLELKVITATQKKQGIVELKHEQKDGQTFQLQSSELTIESFIEQQADAEQ